MKKCGHGCSYWDDHAKNCNVNPKPVTERHPESIGCKFHNGPDAPIDGQLEFDSSDPISLLSFCRDCKRRGSGGATCEFELVPDMETGEPIGVKCTAYAAAAEEAPGPGSLCSRCANDLTNGGEAPCDGDVDDIDGTCIKFAIAVGAWPCGECGHRLNESCPCTGPAADGLCEEFVDLSGEELTNQLCKSCLSWWRNFTGENVADGDGRCPGKSDGAVECDDYKEDTQAGGADGEMIVHSETVGEPIEESLIEEDAAEVEA